MDLFEQLGMSIGGQSVAEHMDSLRATNDTRAIEALHGAEGYTEPQEYVVTVELTVRAYSLNDARDLAKVANRKAESIPDVIDSDVMEVEQL